MILLPVISTVPYLLILLWIFSWIRKSNKFTTEKIPGTLISIIVACRNEEKNLPVLLDHLSLQDYPKDLFEVIIVDDHSADNTAGIVRDFSGKLNLRLVSNSGRGKKEAILTGVRLSGSDFILTTDADCSPGKEWISSFVSIAEKFNPDLVAGPVRLTDFGGFFGSFEQLEFLSLQAITAGTILAGNATMCNGANLAFRKDAWLGSTEDLRFDIATGDDIFLLHSIKKRKGKIIWIESPGAMVETRAAPDLKSFLEQRKRWASKSTAYNDGFSIFLGIVTFVTNLVLATMLVISIIHPHFFATFAIVFLLKSIPDFLLLMNVTARYKKRNLMWWFLPAQIIYPFYVLAVSLSGLLFPRTHL